MTLQKLDVSSGSWHGGIDVVYNIRRTARDLGTLDAGGKGMIQCATKSIAVWSMGNSPPLK